MHEPKWLSNIINGYASAPMELEKKKRLMEKIV